MYKIGVVPSNDYDRDNKIFDNVLHSSYNSLLRKFRNNNKSSYVIHTIDRFYKDFSELSLIIFLGKDWLVHYKMVTHRIPSIYIAQESPIIEMLHSTDNLLKYSNFFSYIMTWNTSLQGSKNFIPFNYTTSIKDFLKLPDEVDYRSKKLLTQVSSNIVLGSTNELYSLRKKLNIQSGIKLGIDYDFYGRDWDGKTCSSYRGSVSDKLATLSNYRFVYTIENCITDNGYVSEKILDAFAARTVPIYYGASNITQFIPKNCFIDYRDFNDLDELLDFIREMSFDEYYQYLTNIEKFFSIVDNPFLVENMNDSIIEITDKLIHKSYEYDINFWEFSFLFYKSRLVYLKRLLKCFLKKLGFKKLCFKI